MLLHRISLTRNKLYYPISCSTARVIKARISVAPALNSHFANKQHRVQRGVLLVDVLCDSLLGRACQISSWLGYPASKWNRVRAELSRYLERPTWATWRLQAHITHSLSLNLVPLTSVPWAEYRNISYDLRKRFNRLILFTSIFRRAQFYFKVYL